MSAFTLPSPSPHSDLGLLPDIEDDGTHHFSCPRAARCAHAVADLLEAIHASSDMGLMTTNIEDICRLLYVHVFCYSKVFIFILPLTHPPIQYHHLFLAHPIHITHTHMTTTIGEDLTQIQGFPSPPPSP